MKEAPKGTDFQETDLMFYLITIVCIWNTHFQYSSLELFLWSNNISRLLVNRNKIAQKEDYKGIRYEGLLPSAAKKVSHWLPQAGTFELLNQYWQNVCPACENSCLFNSHL